MEQGGGEEEEEEEEHKRRSRREESGAEDLLRPCAPWGGGPAAPDLAGSILTLLREVKGHRAEKGGEETFTHREREGQIKRRWGGNLTSCVEEGGGTSTLPLHQ